MELKGYSKFKEIAEGGMAVLYRAHQDSLDRPVAVKVLRQQLVDVPGVKDFFDQESRIVARMDHPNIIRVIDRGITEKGQAFFVMDFVDGRDLSYYIKKGEMNFKKKIRVCLQICKALSYAHKNGVVHRDMKPANVLLDTSGNARVVDFGISQMLQKTESPMEPEGSVLGTPAYMAPEQRRGAEFTTHLSDIYSLGVLMYLMFTNCLPKGEYPEPHVIDAKIPRTLSDLIMVTLSADPEERPQSADDIISHILSAAKGAHLKPKQIESAQQVERDAKDKFSVLDLIQEGEFSSVYLVENRVDNSLMVLKKCIRSTQGFTESRLLSRLRHKNIINILGATKNERIFIVVMEYLRDGSLQNRLARAMSLEEFLPIAAQMCKGMLFAHNQNIIHGNLRPQNILFDGKTVKISDFGFQPHYEEDSKHNWYTVMGEGKSEKNDVFAVGVMFYQMLVAQEPKWRFGKLAPHKPFKKLPAKLQDVLAAMLIEDPEERIDNFSLVLESLPGLVPEKADPIRVTEPIKVEEDSASEPASAVSAPIITAGKTSPRVTWLFFILLLCVNGSLYLLHDYGVFNDFINLISNSMR